MEYAVLGWPPDGPALELDWRRFAYAGKFVMTNTGKAVARDDGAVVGAVAFNEDRTAQNTAWLRYITVREDRRGDGIGPELASFTADAILDHGYEVVRIAVNNPFAYEALYKAGFAFTGEETGIAELILEYAGARMDAPTRGDNFDSWTQRYEDGLTRFAARDLRADEQDFIEAKLAAGPPASR
jgi:GNAT superfamily N-acetyltransferase